MFPPKPQKISTSAARLLGCFSMSACINPILPLPNSPDLTKDIQPSYLELNDRNKPTLLPCIPNLTDNPNSQHLQIPASYIASDWKMHTKCQLFSIGI